MKFCHIVIEDDMNSEKGFTYVNFFLKISHKYVDLRKFDVYYILYTLKFTNVLI